jgi:hypothetical protein
MIHDLVAAAYKGGYRIEIQFDDGKRGVVDFSKYAEKDGVFERFKDLGYFRAFRVHEELGTLTWGDEIDIAPETLYAEVTGGILPEWMEPEESDAANRRLHSDPRDPSRLSGR